MAWDQDEKGNIIAVRLKSFEVAAYPDDNLVLVQLIVGSTTVQVALDPSYAAALAADIGNAAGRVPQLTSAQMH